MPIRVLTPDGEIAEFPDGTDDATITRAMRQLDQEREARARSPESQRGDGPGSGIGAMVGRMGRPGTPASPYERAYRRRAAEQATRTAPTGNPVADALGNVTDAVGGTLDQMGRNLGYADDAAYWQTYLGQGADNLVRQATGRRVEIPARDAARAAEQYERDQQQRFAQERPVSNALSWAASVPATGGIGTAGRVSALQAGVGAAAVNAPFALARQEGDTLQERAPGAALETAVVGGAGAGLQGLANMLTRTPATNSAAARVAEFDAAGVRPMLAAVQGRGNAPMAANRFLQNDMAMAIAENPIGGNVRANLQNSADDVAQAARNLTARAGAPEPREIAGEQLQNSLTRYARDRDIPQPRPGDPMAIPSNEWGVAAKSRVLYDDIFERLSYDEGQMVGNVQGPLLSLDRTRETLASIAGRVSGTQSSQALRSTFIDDMARALEADAADGSLRFHDLREWRRMVREAQTNEGLRQSVDNAALQRLEAALTEDIYASAMILSPGTADDLLRVDRWYANKMRTINEALTPFTGRGNQHVSPARAYRRVIDLASQGGRQNSRQLQQLREALRPDEWRQLSASIMDELGNPNFGNPTIMEPGAFSLENFVSNVARMSDDGRRALFGPLADDLERLARVAGSLKQVRGFTNYSRSGSSAQNIGTISAVGASLVALGAGNPIPLAMLAGAGLLVRITGHMLTNPRFVRWLTSGGGQGVRRQIAALGQIAARDPALAPLYTELARLAGDQQAPGADRSGARREPPPTRTVLQQ